MHHAKRYINKPRFSPRARKLPHLSEVGTARRRRYANGEVAEEGEGRGWICFSRCRGNDLSAA